MGFLLLNNSQKGISADIELKIGRWRELVRDLK